MSDIPQNVRLWKRIARISAWLLLVVVGLLIITGWGITHTGVIYHATFGLVDRGLADSIHKAINLPLVIVFLAHVLINVRLLVKVKKGSHVRSVNALFVLVGLVLIGIFVYVEYLA